MRILPFFVGLGLSFALVTAAAHAAPRVVTDIAPVHSLVAAVMRGVGEPDLLVPGNVSPHNVTLRPSQARAIASADLVVWIGASNTPWLTFAMKSRALGLLEVAPVRIAPREGAALAEHDHHEDGHKGEHGKRGKHGDEEDHSHDAAFDPHAWLHPDNARAWADAIAATLGELDPANAATYRSNATAFQARIDEAEARASEALAGRTPRFLLLHDATAYFEAAFGLQAVGAVSTASGARPGAARLRDAGSLAGSADCVLIEPGLPKRLLNALPNADLPRVVLDVQGANLDPGLIFIRR